MKYSYRTALSLLVALGLLAGLATARDYRTGTADLGTTKSTTKSKGSGDAWLGVYTQSVDRALMRKLDLTSKEGEVITDVVADSPADKAGFEENDVITSVDNSKISDEEDLSDIISSHDPGDKVSITLMRDGKEKQILVALGDREDFDEPMIVAGRSHPRTWVFSGRHESYGFIGVSLTGLNRQLGSYFGVERGKGVLINEVSKGSPAEAAGLKAGDVIVSIDNDQISDIEDAVEIIRDKEEGDKIAVSIMRDRKPMTLTVEVEEESDRGNADLWTSSMVIPPIPPVPAVPKVRIRSHSGDAMEMYLDQAELEKDLAELRKDLSGLNEELSAELSQKYHKMNKDQIRQLKKELQRMSRDVERLR